MHAPDDALLRALHAGAELSPAGCAEMLGVGERQVRRRLDALAALHPIEKVRDGRTVRYRLPEHAREVEHDPLHLTERERLALHVALQAGASVLRGTPLASALDAVQERLRTGNPLHFDLVYHAWHFEGAGEALLAPAIFDTLVEALRDERCLVLDYTNAQGQRNPARRVAPYALASRNGSWLLVAHDALSDETRLFSLPSIAAAKLDDAPADRPDDFDPAFFFRDAFGAFVSGEVEEVRLRVDASAASSFRRKQYHPTQQIEGEAPDGSLVVSFETQGLEALAAFVRSFGPCVEVLDPAPLRERLARESRETAVRYGAA